jgi:hypothetical protein
MHSSPVRGNSISLLLLIERNDTKKKGGEFVLFDMVQCVALIEIQVVWKWLG